MKLTKKVIRYYIASSLLIFALGSVTIYFVLKALIAEEVDETLRSEKVRIVKQLQHDPKTIPANWATTNLEIRSVPGINSLKEALKDTVIFVKETNETIPLRQLCFYTKINNHIYRIILRRSLIEREDLVTGVFAVMIGIFLATILIMNLINIRSDKKLWKPFYETLDKLTTFRLDSKQALNLPKVPIDEFDRLNQTLNQMAEKLQRDYRNLKQFSENTAHEMQTPLAIIRSKLDVLIQDASLSEEQLQTIHSLYQAVSRLSRLNQSLNLLTKIENQEFSEKHDINFNALLKEQLHNFDELIQMKQLKIQTHVKSHFVLNMNPFMAETLVSNLLVNAVQHNQPQGFITIETSEEALTISNSGPELKSTPQELFERFKKDRPEPDSPGLGLSIVQSICRQNGLKIKYEYQDGTHRVRVWKENKHDKK